jgi:hypothetical protein
LAGRHQLDRRRDQVVLQAGVALGCAAHSGRAERRPRGCHGGRQDREPTPLGLRSVPLGGPGRRVFAVGRRQWQWRSSQADSAGEMRPV